MKTPSDMVLYRHVNRPQWGLAVHAWTKGSLSGYQFEDGALRSIRLDYCRLLERVTLVPDDAAHRCAALVRLLGPKHGARRSRRAVSPPTFGFQDQIDLFRDLYPRGFAGETWQKEKRDGGKRVLKRHREPTIRLAQELLSREALDRLVAAEEFVGILERVETVLKSTDLVSASQRRLLMHKDAAAERRFAIALRDLLYGDELNFSSRFERYVSELGSCATWSLATALLALVHPVKHVCVRPTSFKTQARVSMPQLAYDKQPTASHYQGYRTIANSARDKLREAGLSPKDLLDVYDFIWTTLRPKSLKQLTAASPDDANVDATSTEVATKTPAAA
jgi:hypothetical protein